MITSLLGETDLSARRISASAAFPDDTVKTYRAPKYSLISASNRSTDFSPEKIPTRPYQRSFQSRGAAAGGIVLCIFMANSSQSQDRSFGSIRPEVFSRFESPSHILDF